MYSRNRYNSVGSLEKGPKVILIFECAFDGVPWVEKEYLDKYFSRISESRQGVVCGDILFKIQMIRRSFS